VNSAQRDAPKGTRISPDLGPSGDNDEAAAIEWCLSEGLVWTEGMGWVHPDDLAPEKAEQ
jgi:hypothetical protein